VIERGRMRDGSFQNDSHSVASRSANSLPRASRYPRLSLISTAPFNIELRSVLSADDDTQAANLHSPATANQGPTPRNVEAGGAQHAA
jgi:hypothetical protein